jgi:hypothetical protein
MRMGPMRSSCIGTPDSRRVIRRFRKKVATPGRAVASSVTIERGLEMASERAPKTLPERCMSYIIYVYVIE